MATSYADIYDPEVLKLLIAENWLNDARVAQAGLIKRGVLPGQGSLTTNIRQKTFQDSTRQALKGGDEISSLNKKQVAVNAPIIWGYNAMELPDSIEDIAVSQIPQVNTDLAGTIRLAGAQYVDNSVISAMEGVGAALSANQFDGTATTITLASVNSTKAKSLDKINSLDNGGIIMHSKVYYDALALGLVAATANTFGIELQENMVREGVLPTNVLGLTPIVTDKLALNGAQYYSYLVGKDAIELQGGGAPMIEVSRLDKTFSSFVKFKVQYGVGVYGVSWGVSGKEDVKDSELSTSTNWTLSTNTNSNDVAIYRLETD